MIEFQKLTYKNFLAVGDNPITVDLQKNRTTLVVGTNGTGKSTLLDALSYVLFSKPHRNINKIQLVNTVNQKRMVVTVEFKIGTKQYKIVRGLKPSIFEVWVDGEMINQDSHTRDYQKFLESSILKLNYKSFHQVAVVGSSTFTPFMQLNAYDRRMVIEDLLDISIFSKMNDINKEETSKFNKQLFAKQSSFENIKFQIEVQENHINELLSISTERNSEAQEEIDDITKLISELASKNAELISQYNREYEPLQKEKDKEVDTYQTLKKYHSQISTQRNNLKKSMDFFVEHSECPTCTNEIPESLRDEKLAEHKSKVDEMDAALKSIDEKIQESKSKMDVLDSKLSVLTRQSHEVATNTNLIETYREKITKLQDAMVNTADATRIEQGRTKLKELLDDKAAHEDEIKELIDAIHYNEVIAELIKDTGVKTKIIQQYLPYMNSLISNYLNILDFFVSFELDEHFNETIRSRHRDTFSYFSFSEGEKGRINLALLFAWRHIAEMKNSTNTNLLIMDETFDAALDDVGINNLLKIMDAMSDKTNIFVISHKRDLLEDKFERMLEYRRPHLFSEVAETINI